MTALSCREQVLRAIAAKLATIPLPGLVVERDRDQPVRTDEMPRLVLSEGDEVEHPDWIGCRTWSLGVTVEGYVIGEADPDADPPVTATASAAARASELRALVQGVLFADMSLGGLARDIQSDPEAEPVPLDIDGEAPTKAFALALRVEFVTAESDLFTFA
ncbi:MAG: hypothetical protein AB7P02_13265 [Alphaproteobacteria bacterium]